MSESIKTIELEYIANSIPEVLEYMADFYNPKLLQKEKQLRRRAKKIIKLLSDCDVPRDYILVKKKFGKTAKQMIIEMWPAPGLVDTRLS